MLVCLLEEQLEAKDDKRVSAQQKDPVQERDVDQPYITWKPRIAHTE